MAQEGQVNVSVDEEAPQGGDEANGLHEVSAHEFQNMRLSIGTLGRIMLDIALSENLNDTRRIDIRLRQANGPQAASATPANAAQDPEQGDAAPEQWGRPGNNQELDQEATSPLGDAAQQAARARLKITVAAEHEADDKEYLDKMRGWLMTVATLFVNMAFQAMLHPPDWLITSSSGETAASSAPGRADHRETVPRLPFYRYWRAASYLITNVLTFGTSLAMVVVLLQETGSARRTLTTVTAMVCVVSGSLAATFALATVESRSVVHAVYICVVVYESYIAGRVYLGRGPIGYMVARMVGRWLPNSVR